MNFNVNSFLAQGEQAQETYREERRAERAALIEQQDAGIMEITGDPEKYVEYLDRQAKNLRYSPGNTVLIAKEAPDAEQVLSMAEWHKLGRNVRVGERQNGIRILKPVTYNGTRKTTHISEEGEYFPAGETYGGTGFKVHLVYDIAQTTGRAYIPPTEIGRNPEQQAALLRNLHQSCPVPVKASDELTVPAHYAPQDHTVYIRPDLDESQFFAALSGECVQAALHNHGQNRDYRYEDFTLDAASIQYMLCRRYGIETEPLEILADVGRAFAGYPVEDRRSILDANRELAKNMAERLEWGLNRQAEKTRRVTPTRRQGAR
ncbi:MAG TPA: hypothetical protein H9694_09530 [Firmicutes bacterium]|nr:hypothetical protein [Bacillota bacterium]